jgi:GntR family transcriptional regulator
MTPTVIKSGRGPEGITVPIPLSISERIAEDLTELVRSGQLRPGDAIPSAAQLRAQYHCSATPVRDAIRDLKKLGLLAGAAGRAVYVADPLPGWIME